MVATKSKVKALTWSNIQVRLGDLVPWERNPRSSTDRQLAKINESFDEFGQVQPIAVGPDLEVYDGHQRLSALMKTHGPDHLVDARQSSRPLTEKERERLVLLLHAGATGSFDWDQLATWDAATLLAGGIDEEFLKHLTTEVKQVGKALVTSGASGSDRDETIDAPAEVDRAAELRKKWETEVGQVWKLGGHRLMCGDCTKPDDVARLLAGEKPFIMVTDPPYGVDYDPRWRLETGLNKPHQTRAEGTVTNDDRASWKEAWDLFPGTVAYVWHGALHSTIVALDLIDSKFEIRSQIIWAKPSLVIGRGAYHWKHEPCWYASRGTAKWTGDRKQSTVWDIPNMHRTQGNVDDGKTVHSTQKPVECMARPITNHGTKSDHVYDPFVGSGTTIIACEQLGRRCFAMEIDPAYVAVILERWLKATGKQPQKE